MTRDQRILLFGFAVLVILGSGLSHLLTTPSPVSAFSIGPPPSRTGAPGEGTCLSCHFTFRLNDPSGGIVLDGLPESYAPGEPIESTVTVFQDGTGGMRRDWGFQLTVLDDSDVFAGTLVVSDEEHTQIISGDVEGGKRFYIQHNFRGIFFSPEGATMATWKMTWIPPDEDIGPVTFYFAGNAANGDFFPEEDYIFSGSQTVLGPGSKAGSSRSAALARGWVSETGRLQPLPGHDRRPASWLWKPHGLARTGF